MRKFTFVHKNTSVVITLSAEDFHEAENKLEQVVKNTWEFRVENEEGELE
jgi:hypothetical protein